MVIFFSRFNLTITGVVGGGVVIACAFLSAILGTTVLQVRLYLLDILFDFCCVVGEYEWHNVQRV